MDMDFADKYQLPIEENGICDTISLDSEYEDKPEFIDVKDLALLNTITDEEDDKDEYDKLETKKYLQKKLFYRLRSITSKLASKYGQQAVAIIVNPQSKISKTKFNIIGTEPLKFAVKRLKNVIISNLSGALGGHQSISDRKRLYRPFGLPSLVFNGVQMSISALSQNNLRILIPLMLKYSTGKERTLYGKQNAKPCWWPDFVPWKNIRIDTRSENEKKRLPWTSALREVVIRCYKYHNRIDLLGETNYQQSSSITSSVSHSNLETEILINVDNDVISNDEAKDEVATNSWCKASTSEIKSEVIDSSEEMSFSYDELATDENFNDRSDSDDRFTE